VVGTQRARIDIFRPWRLFLSRRQLSKLQTSISFISVSAEKVVVCNLCEVAPR
jgi:hypothetical protein